MSIVLDAPKTEVAIEDRADLPEYYEVVNGEIVEVSPMSDYAGEVAHRLDKAVSRYLQSNDLGDTTTERLFKIPQLDDPVRNRRPDWAFISYDRWPRDRLFSYRGVARDVVPDIAAEVVSPTDSASDLIEKVREYLRGGVRLVWIVYPLTQEIHAYLPGANQVRVYFAADELDAPDILPDFRASVASLFPPVELPPPSKDEDDA